MLEVPEGSWALVTGASSGIGEALARKLAERGIPLILAARSGEKLATLAAGWRERHRVAVETVEIDLSRPGAASALWARTEGEGRPIDLVVANAGIGYYGPQTEQELPRTLAMLQLNVVSVTELVHHALLAMRGRRRGRVLVVSSTTAFLPVPYMTVYAATKAFDLWLAHGLHEEVKDEGITVTALCPGTTRTAFHGVAGLAEGERVSGFPSLDADAVAEAGLHALEKGKPFAVANPLDKAWIFTGRLVPRTFPPKIGAALFSRLRRARPR